MKKKKSNHNLSYFIKPLSGKRLSLYVRHKFGTQNPQYTKTGLVIPEAAWDKSNKEVKSRAEYKDFREKFRQIDKHKNNLLDQLNNHEIQPKQALERVKLYHTVDGYPIREYFEQEFLSKKSKDYDSNKYNSIFNKLEEGLVANNLQHLVPTNISYFKSNKKDIALTLYKYHKPNTATEYLKKLNTVLKDFDLNQFPDKYFKEYYKTEAVTPQKPVPTSDIINAIRNIKTLKQLEAYLFWLYSFCLRGLDGQDVTIVEDSLVVEDFAIEDFIFNEEDYDTPIHIELSRKKTRRRKFEVLINAYPTLSINNALKTIIGINRPNEVNHDDGLKLFKWDRITNQRNWDLYSDFLQGRLEHLIGRSFKSTRHTFTSTAEKLGVSVSDQSALIGNVSRKGSIAHYSQIDQRRMDLIHLAVIGQADIIRIYINLLKHVKTTFEIDLIRDADRYAYSLNLRKHLKSWRIVYEQERERELEDDLDYDFDADVFRGKL